MADVHAGEGNAQCAAHVRPVHAVEQADRTAFGETVALAQLDTGDVGPSILQLDGERGAAADADAQRGAAQVDAAPLDRGEQRHEHGGHAHDLGHAAEEQLGGGDGLNRSIVVTSAPASSGALAVTVRPKRWEKGRRASMCSSATLPPRPPWTARWRAGWRA